MTEEVVEQVMAGRILVVDDEEQIRTFVRDALEDEGYVVDMAGNGASAIARATAARPEVVILDMMLPDMNGELVAAELRSRLGELPILVITADTHAPDKAERSHAYGYLRKPFDLDDLMRLVEQGVRN